MNDIAKLDTFTRAYLVALCFTEDNEAPGGCDYRDTGRAEEIILRLDPETFRQALEDCAAFQETEAEHLTKAGDDEQNGHDFWLTRNGHGAGFWDRGYPKEVSEPLCASAKAFGSVYVELPPSAEDEQEFDGESFTGPECWASYLVNGDASGLADAEISEANRASAGLGSCLDATEVGFLHRPDYGPAGNCCEYRFPAKAQESVNTNRVTGQCPVCGSPVVDGNTYDSVGCQRAGEA